jgi:hypothetical protein
LTPLNAIQNGTLTVNATVYCRGGGCGNVSGLVRYNQSSAYPDSAISSVLGSVPVFLQSPDAYAMKDCGLMANGDFCQLNWTVNLSGSLGSVVALDAYFNSTLDGLAGNDTNDSVVTIFSCTEDFSLSWSSIDFGPMTPSTFGNSAPWNHNNSYNITLNPGSCNLDLYIRGTNLSNSGEVLQVDNMTWSNQSNDYSSSFRMSGQNSPIMMNVSKNTNVTTWYWIDVPSIFAGRYNGTITITGVMNGESP